MANFNADNVARALVGTKSAPGTYNGHIKSHYDEITLSQAVIAVADTINIGKLPRGAKVRALHLVFSGTLGASGTFKVGYAPTTADATDRTSDIAPATAYQAGGSFNISMLNDMISEEKDVILTCTVATTAAAGVKLKAAISFVND